MENINRKQLYEERRREIAKQCENCVTVSPERCNSCTFGKRLRWLEAEFSDVTGWNHRLWNKGK